MLKLLLDIKCGYEYKYITIKNFEYDISYLADARIYERLVKLCGKKPNFELQTEDELLTKYAKNAEGIIRDFSLNSMMIGVLSSEIAAKYFPEALNKESSPLIFPELFVITNVRLFKKVESAEDKQEDAELEQFFKELDSQLDNTEESEDIDIDSTNKHYDA